MRENTFCAQVSQQAREPLIGTAARADLWCLLEYTQRWNESAVRDSQLPAEVLSWYTQMQSGFLAFRMQFIKQHDAPLQTITCFFVVTRHDRQAFYRFQLHEYSDLLHIDLNALVEGAPCYEACREQEPLFLICTHGKHNRCCAKFGLPLYTEVAQLVGERAWQTSHIGGDRFAANLLCMPGARYYGHVTRSDVENIIAATRNQQVYLEKYRGCSSYTPVVQAAEFFVRKQTHILDLDAFQLAQIETIDPTLCRITFLAKKTAARHCVTVQTEAREVTQYSACQGLKKGTTTYYHMQSYVYQEALSTIS